MYSYLDALAFKILFVPHDENAAISALVQQRRDELDLSLREVAKRSERGVSHSQLSNLENQISQWKTARFGVIQGIERGLQWREGFLWSRIHGDTAPEFRESVFELSNSDYVRTVIMLLSSEGIEIGERTVTVKREHESAKLYGFTNQHNTVHSIPPGQSVKIKSQKTYEIGDMVLVKVSGQVILAYTKDVKARRVTTAQGIDLLTEFVWGRAFERLENEGEFKQPKTN